jgi:uncharacterized membrane protein YdbT with pleckstrin-like domain
MRYIDENLISGEHVTYRAKLHWILFLKPLLTSAVLATLAVLLLYLAYDGNPNWSDLLTLIGIALIVIAAVPLVSAMISRSSAEFAVTNKRVILKIGFIQKTTAEMFLNKIESVGVDQSIMGRVLGYGTITIRGTGGSLEPFDNLSAPLEFRRQIQEQIGSNVEAPMAGGRE